MQTEILSFDIALAIRKMVQHMLARNVEIEEFMERRTVFVLVVKNDKTTELGRILDVSAIKRL